MAVFLTVVIVQMRGSDASFQNRIRGGNAFLQIGVADIQAEIHFQMRQLEECQQTLGAGKLVGDVFEQHFHAAFARKQIDFFERRERRIHFEFVVLFFDQLPNAGSGSGTE